MSNTLVLAMFQVLAGQLPVDVLNAFNAINLTGGATGHARVEAVRQDAGRDRPTRILYARAANGDLAILTEGGNPRDPSFAHRIMQKGDYRVDSVSPAPLFQSSIEKSDSDARIVSFERGAGGATYLPRLSLCLARGLREADILSAEILPATDERFETYRVLTSIRHLQTQTKPSGVDITYDQATNRVVRTSPHYGSGPASEVFDLLYDDQGALREVLQRPTQADPPEATWLITALDLSESATPNELAWACIGLGDGAQVIGPDPLTRTKTPGAKIWLDSEMIAADEWVTAGRPVDPIVTLQSEYALPAQPLAYEFGKFVLETGFGRWKQDGDHTPWHALVVDLRARAGYTAAELKRAESILTRAESRVRDIVQRFSNDQRSDARVWAVEFEVMYRRVPNDAAGSKRGEEFRRARELFEDFWKELRSVKSGEYDALTRQFQMDP